MRRKIALFMTILLACSVARSAELTAAAQKVAPNQMVQIKVNGADVESVKKAATTYYPREGVNFFPCITWAGEPVIFFSASKAGTYLVGVYLPTATGGVSKVETEIQVGDAPNPPNPGPDPVPTPGPQKLWVVLIEDSQQRTPASWEVQEVLRLYGEKQQAGRWRRVDVRQETVPAGYTQYLKEFRAAGGNAKLFFVGLDGKRLYAGPLPATPAEAEALTKKHGG